MSATEEVAYHHNVTHGLSRPGSKSMEKRIARPAVNHRRAVLRQLKLSPKDLDPIGRGYLDQYCRTTSKLRLIDAFVEENGFLDPKTGEPTPAMKLYATLTNSARMALGKLEQHLLAEAPIDPSSRLSAYIDVESEEIADDDGPIAA